MNNMVFPTITEKDTTLPYYLSSVGCFYEQEHVIRPNGFPNYQWIQCYKGEGELLLAGVTYRVAEGQGMLLYPKEPHEYYSTSDSWLVDWISMGGKQTGSFLAGMGMNSSKVYRVSQPELLLSKIRNVMKAAQSGDALKGFDCSVLIYDLLISLVKYVSTEGNDSPLQKHYKLKPVFEYIDRNFAKPMTLIELSDVISVSPQYLCTLFRSALNSRVFEYINNVRIQKSKELILSRQQLQIKQIAGLVGFEDFSYYCSVFKRMEKVSPGEFRKLSQGLKAADRIYRL